MTVQPHYPTPPAPGPGETVPRLVVEGSVITANATGLYEGAVTWTVTNSASRGRRLTGPLLRACMSNVAATARVACLVDGVERHVWGVAAIGSGDWGTDVQLVGRSGAVKSLAFSWAAGAAGPGLYRWRVEQVDSRPSILPETVSGEMDVAAEGAVTVTVPLSLPAGLTEHRDYAIRPIIQGPDGTLYVRRVRYVRVLPRPQDNPAYQWPVPGTYDDRFPVPAGALGADIQNVPLLKAGDDPLNPTYGSADAVARLFEQRASNGSIGMNVNAFGVSAVRCAVGDVRQAQVWDTQYKMVADTGWSLSQGGHLVWPSTMPPWSVPPTGADGAHMAIMPTADGKMWDIELWKLRFDEAGGVRGAQGGRIDLTVSNGTFPQGKGVSASGLALGPVAVTMYQVQESIRLFEEGKSFDHLWPAVIPIVLPRIRSGAQNFFYPATRTDGIGAQQNTPMGARFRIAASVDLAAEYAAGRITKLEHVVFRGMQLRGMMVVDTTGSFMHVVARTYPEAQVDGQPNPWSPVFGSRGSYNALAGLNQSWVEAVAPVAAGEPTSMTMPAPAGATETETVVVDGAHVTITDLLSA